MRTTEELIEELHAKATGAFVAGIVVGFEKKTEFVWVNSPDPLGDLNALTKRGGEPIAVYRVDKSAGTLNCTFEPFEEYARESWVRAYLDSLGTGFMKLVEAQTGGNNRWKTHLHAASPVPRRPHGAAVFAHYQMNLQHSPTLVCMSNARSTGTKDTLIES